MVRDPGRRHGRPLSTVTHLATTAPAGSLEAAPTRAFQGIASPFREIASPFRGIVSPSTLPLSSPARSAAIPSLAADRASV